MCWHAGLAAALCRSLGCGSDRRLDNLSLHCAPFNAHTERMGVGVGTSLRLSHFLNNRLRVQAGVEDRLGIQEGQGNRLEVQGGITGDML